MTPLIRFSLIATLIAIAVAQVAFGIANARPNSTGGPIMAYPLVVCEIVCVHGGTNPRGTPYQRCKNRSTGIMSIKQLGPAGSCN